jgi:hypothetical protein
MGIGMETVNTWIRASLTLLLLALTVWWLYYVAAHLGTTPTVDDEGNVILDQFERSKSILLVVLPLLTTALGYWFGAAGKAKAEEGADVAKAQLNSVLDVADKGVLETAKKAHPTAFGLPDPSAPKGQ